MVKTNFMFQSLSPVQRDQLFQVMELRYVIRGQRIIKQGDEGDEMYIVDRYFFACIFYPMFCHNLLIAL